MGRIDGGSGKIKQKAAFLLTGALCLGLTGCGVPLPPEKAADGSSWDEDWVTVGGRGNAQFGHGGAVLIFFAAPANALQPVLAQFLVRDQLDDSFHIEEQHNALEE